ncbi:hypothetical protein HDK77DRAFT_458103 [Phyllosticta capitalensis]
MPQAAVLAVQRHSLRAVSILSEPQFPIRPLFSHGGELSISSPLQLCLGTTAAAQVPPSQASWRFLFCRRHSLLLTDIPNLLPSKDSKIRNPVLLCSDLMFSNLSSLPLFSLSRRHFAIFLAAPITNVRLDLCVSFQPALMIQTHHPASTAPRPQMAPTLCRSLRPGFLPSFMPVRPLSSPSKAAMLVDVFLLQPSTTQTLPLHHAPASPFLC